MDLLSGCYSVSGHPVMVGLFHLLRGSPDGTFAAAEPLKGTDERLLMVHHEFTNRDDQLTDNICTRPFACDWDGDGDLDLVVGNFKGTFYVFSGEGGGRFLPDAVRLDAGGKALKTRGAHSDPFVIDWDGDGDLDLLASSSTGDIEWAENSAEEGGPPSLGAFRTLIRAAPGGPETSTRIHVEDFDRDGKLDILVGDQVSIEAKSTGQVWLFLQR